MFKRIFNSIKKFLEPIAKVMQSIVNFILLSAVYFIGIGLVSVIMKIFGKHFLNIKKTGSKSNWAENKTDKSPIENYMRTF